MSENSNLPQRQSNSSVRQPNSRAAMRDSLAEAEELIEAQRNRLGRPGEWPAYSLRCKRIDYSALSPELAQKLRDRAATALEQHGGKNRDAVASYGQIMAHHLDALGVPESLKKRVDYVGVDLGADRPEWPPEPGCGPSPDDALVRMWARIDLAEWITSAPNAFGPHGTNVLQGLAETGARLRRAGEGAVVLWGIDVVAAEQWVDHPAAALAVSELVCLGPHLPERLVNRIDYDLARLCWSFNAEDTNLACVVNNVAVAENSWHDGNTISASPPLREAVAVGTHPSPGVAEVNVNECGVPAPGQIVEPHCPHGRGTNDRLPGGRRS